MKQIFVLVPICALLAMACNNSPKKKPLRQEDLPIHQDTVNIAEQEYYTTDSLNKYIAENPNDVSALANRGQEYIAAKNMPYAIADAKAAMALDSLNPDALLLWGDVNYLKNNSRASRDAWKTCIEQDKENVNCRLKLAELYNIVQEYRLSLKLVNEVLDIDENNATAYFIKGMNVRDMAADTALALQYFQRAVDLDNNNIAALDMLGVLLSARKDPVALAYFNRILEINPNHHATYYNMGMFYIKTEDWNNAIKAFTKCTQIYDKDDQSLFNLGYIHLQLKVNDVAKDYFSEALEIKPINPKALYGRGYAYEMMGDIRNAEKDYRTALQYNPDHSPSKIALARIYEAKQAK